MNFRSKILVMLFVAVLFLLFLASIAGCANDEFTSDIVTDEELEKIEGNTVLDLDNIFDNRNDESPSMLQTIEVVPGSQDDSVLQSVDEKQAMNSIILDNEIKNADSTSSSTCSENINDESIDDTPDTVDDNETITYVLNKNTKKFHYDWCKSSSEIKEKNKEIGTDRESVIARGFIPCKRCNP